MHYDLTQGFSEQNESQSDREEQRQISDRSGGGDYFAGAAWIGAGAGVAGAAGAAPAVAAGAAGVAATAACGCAPGLIQHA